MSTGRGSSATRGATTPGAASDGPRRPSLALQPFAWNGLQILPLAPTAAESIAVVPPPLPALHRTAPFRVSEYEKRSHLAVAALEAALGFPERPHAGASGLSADPGTDRDASMDHNVDHDPDSDLDPELCSALDLSDLAVPIPPGIGPSTSGIIQDADQGQVQEHQVQERSPPQLDPAPSGSQGNAAAASGDRHGATRTTATEGDAPMAEQGDARGPDGLDVGRLVTSQAGGGAGADGGAGGSGGGTGGSGGGESVSYDEAEGKAEAGSGGEMVDPGCPQRQELEPPQGVPERHQPHAELPEEAEPAPPPQVEQQAQDQQPQDQQPQAEQQAQPGHVPADDSGARPAKRRRVTTAKGRPASRRGRAAPATAGVVEAVLKAEEHHQQPEAQQHPTEAQQQQQQKRPSKRVKWADVPTAIHQEPGSGADGAGGGGDGRGLSGRLAQPLTRPGRSQQQRQQEAVEVAAWWERLEAAAAQLDSLKAVLQAAPRQAPGYGAEVENEQPGNGAGLEQSGSGASPPQQAADRDEEERLLREELALGERARQRLLDGEYDDPYGEGSRGKARWRGAAAGSEAVAVTVAASSSGAYGPATADLEGSGEGPGPRVPAAAAAALERIRFAVRGPDRAAAGPRRGPWAAQLEPGARGGPASMPAAETAEAASRPPQEPRRGGGEPEVDGWLRDDVVVWVSVCGAGLPHVLHEEFLVLGSQTLDQLRDVLGCGTEDAMREAAAAAAAASAAAAEAAAPGGGAAAAAVSGDRGGRGQSAPAAAAARGRGGGRRGRGRGGGRATARAKRRGCGEAEAPAESEPQPQPQPAPQEQSGATAAAAEVQEDAAELPAGAAAGAGDRSSGGTAASTAGHGGAQELPEDVAADGGTNVHGGSGDAAAPAAELPAAAAAGGAVAAPPLSPELAVPSPAGAAAAVAAACSALPPSHGSYIFLEGRFYTDVRHPEAEDYTVPIRELFKAHGVRPMYLRTERGWRPALTRDHEGTCGPPPAAMHSTRFSDLTLRLANQPVGIFCHRACCEHLLFVRDVRRWHPGDPPRRDCFPLRLRARDEAGQPVSRRRCSLCEARFAELVTHDDPLAPFHPAIMCRHCFDLLHIGSNGERLAPSVMVQPYNPAMDISALQGTWATSAMSWASGSANANTTDVAAQGNGGCAGGIPRGALHGGVLRVRGLRKPL